MANEKIVSTSEVLAFNNARAVLDDLQSEREDCQEQFLTMVQGNAFSGVTITDSNIGNNSRFIVDLWG